MLLIFNQKKFNQIKILYIILPLERLEFKYRSEKLCFFVKILSKFLGEKLTVYYDDFRMKGIDASHRKVSQFPYCATITKPKITFKNSEKIIFIPGYFFAAKKYLQSLLAIQGLGEEYILDQNIFVKIRGSSLLLDELEDWFKKRVMLIQKNMDNQEYFLTLLQSSLIMLVYDQKTYSLETGSSSGVVRESLYLGKPILTTEGTWMSAFLANYIDEKNLLLSNEQIIDIQEKIKFFFNNEIKIADIFQKAAQEYQKKEEKIAIEIGVNQIENSI